MSFPGTQTYPSAQTYAGFGSAVGAILAPDVYYDGVSGNTPLSADAVNRIWAALMQALVDQLVPRAVTASNSANIRDMMLVDASNGPVTIQAPQAVEYGQWGARKIDSTSNPVTLVATGADVLDEHNRTTYTLTSQDDDAVFAYASPGHFMFWRGRSQALPATATTYGPIKIAGDLAGTADAIRVPGKENVGVANNLIAAHTIASDPHGDRGWANINTGNQIQTHTQATDPHGDRNYANQQFVPLSWFGADGTLLSSHTSQLAITSTQVVTSQAAMLALTAQQGDVAVRTDTGTTYILQGTDPTVLANWTVLPAVGKVASVNGQQGSVVLGYADVGAAGLVHASRHYPGGADDISTQYISWATMGTASGPAAYTDTRITGAQPTSAKGALGGYAGLDATYGRVPMTQTALGIPSTIYTAAHTPTVGEIARYNAGGGSFTQVLPAAPTGNTVSIIEVKNLTPVAQNNINTVTFTPAGTDTIDMATGQSIVLRFWGETRRLVGFQGNWAVQDGLNPISGMDSRYLQTVNAHMPPAGGATGYALTKNTANDYDWGWAAVGAAVNVQTNLNIVSVKAYGAVGNGTTDDTNAINNALAATPAGGVCYLPPGNYGIISPIVVPPQVTLEGAHTETLIYNTGSPTATPVATSLKVLAAFTGVAAVRLLGMTAGGYAYYSVGQKLRRVTIDYSAAPANTKGLQIYGFVREATIEFVTIKGVTGTSLGNAFCVDKDAAAPSTDNNGTAQSLRFLHCAAHNPGGSGFSISACPDTTMIDCNSEGAGFVGFYLAGMANGLLMGCRSEWSSQHGYYITSGTWASGVGSGGFMMFGCMSDRNGSNGVFIDATGGGQIMISGLDARRDGRNNNTGGGNFAAIQATGATMPVIISGLKVYPGVDDTAGNTTTGNSPQFGVRAGTSTHVSVGGGCYIHAQQAAFSDAGGNGLFYRGPGIATATGTTDAPTRVGPAAPTPVAEPVNTVAASGAAYTIPDIGTATVHDLTLTAACTFTFPTAAAGKSFTLILRQDATGGRAVTWPTIKWPAATAPTLTTAANAIDILTFIAGPTSWHGALSIKDAR